MLNILVTGAKGFIGKNLLKKLDKNQYNIFEFNRNDSLEVLEQNIIQCDFIVHLAGEVRPNSTDDDFKNSNALLTKTIIELLNKNNKTLPILMASTIHAKLLKNEYGKTKREAEVLLENYANETNVRCFIYRLPHVFGEGCKPNYNSVVTTWIYNSIKDLEINCFDRSIQMHYVYVQDIVDDFLSIINKQTSQEIYIEPKQVYKTTLGEIVDYIDEFKYNIQSTDYCKKSSELKQKLFSTYLDYYKELHV